MWYVSFVYEPIVFSELELCGNSLRPPLSWLGVSVVALTVGFRPQLYAITTIVAKAVGEPIPWASTHS
jgi:hypothetical protein